jgi:hypothetical protein
MLKRAQRPAKAAPAKTRRTDARGAGKRFCNALALTGQGVEFAPGKFLVDESTALRIGGGAI